MFFQENVETKVEENMPQHQDSAKQTSEENIKEEIAQASPEENGTEGIAEVSKTVRKRRRDPVADPSSLGPRTLRLRQKQDVPMVENPKKVKQMDGNSTMCHQCQRNDSGRVVRCQSCIAAKRRYRYCVKCITRWYPHLSEDDFEKSCPVCRNNCNCKACLRGDTTRSKVSTRGGKTRRKKSMRGDTTRSKKSKKSSPIEADEWSVSEEDKIKYSVRAVHFLLPWLKEFHQEQTLERSVEASIEGNMILLPLSRFLA